jgi:hypothetical protein
MSSFSFHVIIAKEDICNYRKEQAQLLEYVFSGKKVVLIGRRNTGKTSLVRSVIGPEFRKKSKNGLVIYVDFMGVKDMDSIARRRQVGFEEGFRESFPKTSRFHSMVSLLKGIRPTISVDPTSGETSLSITSIQGGTPTPEEILKLISALHQESPVLLIFDEFQHIALVDEAEARLRAALQNLPKELPVIVLGSKKHLLAQIFTRPNAPFASWGIPLELPPISKDDYHPYIMQRFQPHGLQITQDTVGHLLATTYDTPEALNIICDTIVSHWKNQVVDEQVIGQAITLMLDRMQSGFREFLAHFTLPQIKVLTEIAKKEPILKTSSAAFLKGIGLSQAGVSLIIKKFEDEAIIYRTELGYIVADPLLAMFLRRK